jgi:ABC-type nitrate/sulfonate/bicarbonate transport system substrate-binding protein
VSQKLNRRAFLGRSLTAGAGLALASTAGGTLLAACGSDSDSSSSSASTTGSASTSGGDFGTLDYQFSWIKNVEFAGNYIADSKGYYTDAGFSSVNFMAGGPTVQQDAVVASGRALIGLSGPDITSPAILQGAPIKALGAMFQRNPFCVMSLADTPVLTPEDMYGKTFGMQAVNEPVWASFVKANNLDASQIEIVPVQFDPQPLVAGEVDCWFSWITNEPNLLAVQGVETATFLLADFNYAMPTQILIATEDSIENKRDALKAVMKADIMGWHDSISDPAAGAELAANDYGKDLGLTVEEQTLESVAQNKLIVTADTLANGIMTLTDALVSDTIATLALGGTEITAEQLFDFSVLEEVYEENPDLKATPEVVEP